MSEICPPDKSNKQPPGAPYDAWLDPHVARYQEQIRQAMDEGVVLYYPDLNIDTLAKLPISDKYRLEAQRRMVEREEKDPRWNPWTTIHVDRKGHIMAAVFAYRIIDKPDDFDMQKIKLDFASDQEFYAYCTESKIQITHDGMDEVTLRRLRQIHACFNAFRKPLFQDRDSRHSHYVFRDRFPPGIYDFKRLTWKYMSKRYPLFLNHAEDIKKFREERKDAEEPYKLEQGIPRQFEDGIGVDHLFLAWHAQGHPHVAASPVHIIQ